MTDQISPQAEQLDELYQHSLILNSGETLSLSDLSSQVLLIVNTASRCGFTPQYHQLEELHQSYRDQGLTIIGCPCDQFASQEFDTDSEVQAFCQLNFNLSFMLTRKLKVNGPQAHPLFMTLKRRAPGLLGTERIKWNFTKFLIAPQGIEFKRFAPKTAPNSFRKEIERFLSYS